MSLKDYSQLLSTGLADRIDGGLVVGEDKIGVHIMGL